MDVPWYRDGLRFACAGCGRCCRGAGTVAVSDAEITALARRVDLREEEFRTLYTRTLRGGSLSLREKSNRDCVFWQAGVGCRVYEDRPRQCRTWPFWSAVVHSEERWQEEARTCPGMNHGPLHGAEWIHETSARDGTGGGER